MVEMTETYIKDEIELEYGKGLSKNERQEGEFPVYGSNGIIDYNNKPYYKGPGIIIGRKGTVGSVKYEEKDFWAIDTTYVVNLKNKNDNLKFWYYFLQTLGLEKMNSHSAVPGLSRDRVYNIKVRIPKKQEDREKISKILRTLDNKIELNNQINDNLHEIMHLKFNNWVNNLEEYKISNLSAIANYKNGLAMQKYRPNNEIGLPVIKIKEMNSGISNETERCKSDINSDVIVNNGDVLFAWSGTLCMTIWDSGKAGLNQHIFKVTSEKYPKWFYYFWTLKHLGKFIQIAAGKETTMGHIKRGELDSSQVLIPKIEEINRMDKLMTPMLNKYIENKIENKTLEQLRDTLLPKLMNGEIELENIEI